MVQRRSSYKLIVYIVLAILLVVLVVWHLQERSLDKAIPRRDNDQHQESTRTVKPTGKPIVPLSVVHSWSAVYGDKGCPKNHWRPGLVKLFKAWSGIASKYNIEYVLTCGSLLGALRTGDVIPYDSDLDVLVNIKQYDKLKKLAAVRNFKPSDGKIRLVLQPEFERNVSTQERKRYTCAGKLSPNMVDVCSFQDPMGRLIRKYLQIDMYPLYEKGDVLLDTTDGDIRTYKKTDMFPLRPCTMMGFDSYCPQNPWNILKAYYRTDKFEPTYKCKGDKWVDKNNKRANF